VRPGPLDCGLAHRRARFDTQRVVAGHCIRSVGHQRWHALLGAVSVYVATGNAEYEAIEVVRARTGDAPAETLIGAREETREAVRAEGARLTGGPAIHACVAFACEARNAVVGVVATGLAAQATSDAEVALICRIAAVIIVLAAAATGDETSREIVASREKADFPGRARVVLVAQGIHVRASGTKGAGIAPRAASIWGATIWAGVGDAAVDTGIVDGAVAPIDATI